jgi:hypothetical protein
MNHTASYSTLSFVLGLQLLIVDAAITTAQAQLDGPGSGLVGWWRFDEASGTIAYDSSGNGHNGTLINGPARVAGKTGTGALSFDGISTMVDIPSSPDFDFSGDFSASAWVFSKTGSRVTALGRALNNLWQLWTLEQITATTFSMELVRADSPTAGRQGYLATHSGFTTNAWHHVAGVKSGTTITIYVDGTPGSPVGEITNANPTLAGIDITIGSRRAITPDQIWNGYVDDVRVYNRALSASEIWNLTDSTSPSVTAFSVPATSSSLIVPVISFTASDNVGVTGYMVTESSAAPLATDPRWTVTAPTSYTFSSFGSKTLYAWARDAAGNVSASLSASVTIGPELRDVHMTDGQLVATFDAVAGKTYVLEQSTNLAAGWFDLQTIGPVSNSVPITVEAPITAAGVSFFRLRVEP